MKELQFLKGLVTKVKQDDYTLEVAIASDNSEDRMGEVIEQEGWELDNFKSNPVLLWSHNHREPPIGKVVDIKIVDNKLLFRPQFAVKENDFAEKIWKLYKGGFLSAFSVGFKSKERQGDTFKRAELLEISAVPVPSNANALVVARELGIESHFTKEMNEEKSVVPFTAYPTAPEGRDWGAAQARRRVRIWASRDGSGEKDTIDWRRYARAFTWFDREDRENFRAYSLPHHDVIGGEVRTVWRGVAAAMAVLLGARGGVDIPAADRRRVYGHLSKHYAQFDREVPELREYSATELKEMEEKLIEEFFKAEPTKEKIINEATKTKIKQTLDQTKIAADALSELLENSTVVKDNDGLKPAGSSGAVKNKPVIKVVRTALKEATKNLELANRSIKIINKP